MINRSRPGLFGYPSENPTILIQQRNQLAAYVIEDVLSAANLPVKINAGSVHIRDRLIFFDTEVRKALSNAIYGRTFPRVEGGEFFHHTGVKEFAGIAESGELRLYSLRKRMDNPFEGELLNLARLEGWRGLEAANDDATNPDAPGSNLFYTSLTSAGNLWSFGSIRLRLRVNTTGKMAQLREVQYHAADDVTLLGSINAELASEGLPPILPESSYRMAAYSIPDWLRGETETRLVHLHFDGQQDRRKNDGKFYYWPVGFGVSNEIADITLIGIEINSEEALDQASKALADTPLSSIVPTLTPTSETTT